MEWDLSKRYLVIVESPNKCKTLLSIFKDLGFKNIAILASVGHITKIADTGEYNLGIDTKTFECNYIINSDKKDIFKKLQEQTKVADYVFIASDGDREGEAIAYALKTFLKIPENKYSRLIYHEITKSAIKKALDNPLKIDNDLVDAAHTRSRLDKIVGYRLSPLAIRLINARSVGRCQSAGLKIVVDREKEINNFKSETYYELYLNFKKNKKDFKAKYVNKLKDKKEVEKIVDSCLGNDYVISDIQKKEVKQNQPLPFITSSFQQEVSSRLGIGVKDAMSIAQKLFEGIDVEGKHIALCTYLRTDDPSMAPEFVEELKKYITDKYGKNYYQGLKEVKKKDMEQAGHECFRVINLDMTPDKLSKYISNDRIVKVYDIIYRRTIASVMPARIISETTYSIDNNSNIFNMVSKEEIFDGWKKVYNYQDKDKEEIIKETFDKGEILQDCKLVDEEKKTQPPSRYTEASLIKTLDKLGIGRPSTYATIISTLLDDKRGYCKIEDKKMVPTRLAFELTGFLEKNFKELVDSSYTANLEKSLDKVAEGKMKDIDFLKPFYQNLEEDIKKIAPNEDKICPECGGRMILRKSKWGSNFYGCSNYPKCRHIEKC